MPSPLSPAIALQTQELASILDKPNILPVFVGSREAFQHAHIKGSAHLQPQQLVCGHPPAAGKIPDADELSDQLSSIGLTENSIVIAYDDEGGGWAGRLIWTLDIINHRHYHFLDGGIIAWLAENRPVSQGNAAIQATQFSATIDNAQLVTAAEIINSLGKDNFAIWDARSAEEHSGEKILAARGGHIPGAVNLDWLELMDRNNHLRLKPLEDIKNTLDNININKSKQIITHCQSHHRSGLSYVVGKLLGLDIRGYDGSWSEWGNSPDTPIES